MKKKILICIMLSVFSFSVFSQSKMVKIPSGTFQMGSPSNERQRNKDEHNIHGNVSEWVFDFYGAYDSSDSKNPAGSRTEIYRVNRGGAYNDFGKHLRSA